MPKSRVTKKDTLKTYTERCMTSEAKTFPDPKQRYAVCASYYKESKKKK